MICAFCESEIDHDFFYCDMCGEEIKTCPACKRPGKGKVCTSHGKPLISAKAQTESSVDNGITSDILMPPPPTSVAQVTSSTTGGTFRLPDTELNGSGTPQLRLLNMNINVNLRVDDNSIIGRTAGQYVAIFSVHDQISSRHCRFNYDAAKGWTVTDLESTNKTKYNGQELLPNNPQLISDQSYLKIANIEFFVRIIPG